MSDIVRVLRIYEFVGEREAVEKQVKMSIHGEKQFRLGWFGNEQTLTIRAATIGTYPEILASTVLGKLGVFEKEER